MDMNGPFWTLGSVGGPWDALARMPLIWFQADPGALGRMAEDLPKSSWRIRGHGSETHGPSELVLGKNVNYIENNTSCDKHANELHEIGWRDGN